jgi:hypothetical protein
MSNPRKNIPHIECACVDCRHKRLWLMDVEEVLERVHHFFENSLVVQAPTLARDVERVHLGLIIGETNDTRPANVVSINHHQAVSDTGNHQNMAHHDTPPSSGVSMG